VGKAFVLERNELMARTVERWVIAQTRSRAVEELLKIAAASRELPKLDRVVIGQDVASRLRKLHLEKPSTCPK